MKPIFLAPHHRHRGGDRVGESSNLVVVQPTEVLTSLDSPPPAQAVRIFGYSVNGIPSRELPRNPKPAPAGPPPTPPRTFRTHQPSPARPPLPFTQAMGVTTPPRPVHRCPRPICSCARHLRWHACHQRHDTDAAGAPPCRYHQRGPQPY